MDIIYYEILKYNSNIKELFFDGGDKRIESILDTNNKIKFYLHFENFDINITFLK
jgi:hypothetical protein